MLRTTWSSRREVRERERGWALQKMLLPFLRLFVIAGKPEKRWPNQAILALNPAYTTDNLFSCLFLPLDSRVSPLLAPQTPSDRQTIQHVHWLESLLSMFICKKCPSQPFLSPE